MMTLSNIRYLLIKLVLAASSKEIIEGRILRVDGRVELGGNSERRGISALLAIARDEDRELISVIVNDLVGASLDKRKDSVAEDLLLEVLGLLLLHVDIVDVEKQMVAVVQIEGEANLDLGKIGILAKRFISKEKQRAPRRTSSKN